VSLEARELVKSILSADPSKREIGGNVIELVVTDWPMWLAELRPTLNEMLHHPWFTSGPIPSHVSSSALLTAPEYHEMTREEIKHNFYRVKRKAGVGQNLPLRVPKAETVETPQEVGKEVERAVKQQEAEYQTAIQPGSPISALLR
jgi:cell cycle serine/threonine-protein kinase CDC5/MSD2